MSRRRSKIQHAALKILEILIENNAMSGKSMTVAHLLESCGIPKDDFDSADTYLLQQHYVGGTMGGASGARWLTARGIDFHSSIDAPAVNVISVGTMVNSNVQQSSPGASQTITLSPQMQQSIRELLQDIHEGINQLNLEAQQRANVEADIRTIEAQLVASDPKGAIVSECLVSIRRILESAAGGVLASGIAMKIGELLSS